MSFGLLKHFKDLKRDASVTASVQHCKHVVLGHGLGSVLKLVELKKSYPEDSIKLIASRPVNRQTLIEDHQYGLSLLRSPEAVESVYRRYFNAKISPQTGAPVFYKEGKFHDFGGRAKSMELQAGEEYFTRQGHELSVASLFSEEDWGNLDTLLSQVQDIRLFDSIEKTTPTDLVEKAEWTLVFKDYARLTCENLYVGVSPKKFLNLLGNKDELSSELIDLCSSVSVQAGLSVTWELDKEYYSEERTLFVPQSMTHEWGHFIVEFSPFKHQTKTQLCHVLFLVHEEEPQPEELGSKIKLMKRVLDRVFPDIEKHIKKEFIRFDDEMFISDVKDSALEQIGFDYPNLKFLGQASAVRPEHSSELFLSRTLLGH